MRRDSYCVQRIPIYSICVCCILFIVSCAPKISNIEKSGVPQCCDLYKQLYVMQAQYKNGMLKDASSTYYNIATNKCWNNNYILQLATASIVVSTIHRNQTNTIFDLILFSDSDVCELIYNTLKEKKCYDLLLGNGMVLLGNIRENERIVLVKELYSELVNKKLPDHLSSMWITYLLVANAMAAYPYPGTESDLWNLFIVHPDESIIHPYIAVCYKNHSTIPVNKLERILKEDKRKPFIQDYTFSYLYYLCSDKEKARLMILAERPNLPKEVLSKDFTDTIGAWVKGNFDSIIVH